MFFVGFRGCVGVHLADEYVAKLHDLKTGM